ncbi:beta-ketoacyl-ACP synthase [Achromobacter denitrificans]
MTTWLSAPGIVCALGQDLPGVARAAFQGSTAGMRPLAGWVREGEYTLGACAAEPPALPGWLEAHHHSRNNRLLLAAARQIEPRLRRALERYGAARIGIVVGTSTSGVNDGAPAFRALAAQGAWPPSYDYRRQELSAPSAFLARWAGIAGPAYTLSTACTSSARALLSARRLLEFDLCDAVLCGGADTLCRLAINGFAALEALDPGLCRPFSVHRAGINIGEAAALFLMEREPADADAVALLGGGASSDAWHMSAPDPTGAGAARAMRAALDDAGIGASQIGWVNLHGTGTLHNDAMESQAMMSVFPGGVPCASTKALTGHTLGAAGALEAAMAWITLSARNPEGELLPHVWDGEPDPALPALQFSTARQRYARGRPRLAMSNSFAFGGNNACLVLGAQP